MGHRLANSSKDSHVGCKQIEVMILYESEIKIICAVIVHVMKIPIHTLPVRQL